jgi:hypothetical protein
MHTPQLFDRQLQRHFLDQLTGLWPVLKGSLAEIRKPCIRPHCLACACGDKHPAFILSFSDKGRRRCMYVPAELVPRLRQALKNGRRLERLLGQLGPAFLHHYRQQRDERRAS